MRASSSIGLSQLKLPELQEFTADENAVAIGKSSPWAQVLLNTIVSRQAHIAEDLNQLTHAVMMATAEGANLDQAVALLGVKRQIITPADNNATPPTPAVMEDDERLRLRARYCAQALNHSGCEGSYRFYALSASADVKDVAVFSRDWLEGNQNVSIFILSRYGRGDEEDENNPLLETVRQSVANVASITDDIDVRWANVIPYSINAKLEFDSHTDKNDCLKKVKQAVTTLINDNHRLGKNVVRDEILAQLYQPGVEQALLIKPENDIAVPLDSVAFNPAIGAEDGEFIIEEANALLIEGHSRIQTTVRAPQYVQMASQWVSKPNEE